MSNFDFIATYVDLSDSPTYTTNITLEGQLLKISFVWNERIGKRTIFIRNSADICYLQNTILHPNESFELNSNAVFDDLPYKVVLQKVGDTNKVGNIYNWSKDFILCFYRTVDIETEKLNVKYGITTPSTPTLPKPFGPWIVNEEVRVFGDNINYTAYKTNDLQYYDSFADFDLSTALLRSFHDTDMQGWQGFIDAANELTGVTDWIVSDDKVTYISSINPATLQYLWTANGDNRTISVSPDMACTKAQGIWGKGALPLQVFGNDSYLCSTVSPFSDVAVWKILNSEYNPSATNTVDRIDFYIIAQKIISNTLSSNEGISLLAEAYIDEVANSINNTNVSKQFVKIEDLVPQLETNKVLR